MSDARSETSTTRDREILLERVFDAPRELVWDAWTDHRHISNWWGPRGFTTTTHEVDLRPGGAWRFTMHGPDGTDYDNMVIYVDLAKPERLVYEHSGDNGSVFFRSTVNFDDVGAKTKVTLRMVFPTAAARDETVQRYGAIEGGKQTLERLAEHLAKKM